MLLSSLFYALLLLAGSALGLLTTGVPGSTTATRYEIRQLASKSPRQFTLFLLAMQQYQSTSQNTQTSYYQISGIHGVPRTSFDSVGQCSACTKADGYCPHNSILFLGWHRAYLALFEQQLVAIAKNIASQYPASTRAAYQQAASNLRLPFWDWAAAPPNGGNTLPQQLTAPTVQVSSPTGTKTINNPLYSYKFASTSALVYPPFTSWPNTLRYPTSNAASATSQQSKAIAAFNNIRGSLQDRLYQIFSTCTTYEQVGLDSTSTAKCSNSLEQLHNTVHTTSGGPATKNPAVSGGDMTYLSLAAFDPLFWLHHCNVDRLFAMWQAVYPNSYGASANQQLPTWTIPAGAGVGANTGLTPFRKSTSAFWTTNDVRDTKVFKYTYPEFADSSGSSADIKSYINKLYGPSATATAGSSKRTAAPQSDLLDGLTSTITAPLIKAANGSLFQYVANIQTPRYALAGSYNIFLFNGAPSSSNPADYMLDENLIGPMGVLASSKGGPDTIVAGSIPLTRFLTNAVGGGLLSDLTEAVVVPFLAKNLQWIIVGPDGSQVDPSTLQGFDITVFASTSPLVSADELPVWSQFIALEDVTNGQANTTKPATGSAAAATATGVSSAASDATTASPLTAAKATRTRKANRVTAAVTTPATDALPSVVRRRARRF